jgi:hypothetical protein
MLSMALKFLVYDELYQKLKEEDIPLDSGLIFPFAGSVLVCGCEQLLL